MFGSMLIAVLVLAVGTELTERVRVRQEEWILKNLHQTQAIAYYEVLKRRVRKVRILRGLVLVAMMVAAMSIKRILLARAGVRS